MADVYDEKTRSSIMKKVKSSGNKSTELKLIKLFNENGIKGACEPFSVNSIFL